MAKKELATTIGYQTKKTLGEQRYEVILAYILDPEGCPLPEQHKEQFNRVKSAAQMLDEYHPRNVIPRLLAKYNITRYRAQEDVRLAQELFKSKHTFDWDFWQEWQIKDLVDTIRTCKLRGKHKERIAAQKVLREVIGEKPMGIEDPKRMESNMFNLQINNNKTVINIPFEKLKGLSADDISLVVTEMISPDVEDGEIVDILNT